MIGKLDVGQWNHFFYYQFIFFTKLFY